MKYLKVFGLLFLLLSVHAFSQTNVNEEQGLKPYDSWHGGDLDSISMTNGGGVIHIPLVSFPQRGNIGALTFTVYANTKTWQSVQTCVPDPDPNAGLDCTWKWEPLPRGGFRSPNHMGSLPSLPVEGAYITSNIEWALQNTCEAEPTDPSMPNQTTYDWSSSLTAPDGNVHQFGNGISITCPAASFRSLDGTGIMLAGTTAILPNGTQLIYPGRAIGMLSSAPNTVIDSNGNKITIDSNSGAFTDTLGRAIPAPPGTATSDLSSCPSGTTSAQIWNVPGLTGGTRAFKFCYSTISIYTSFNDGADYPATNNTLLTAIVLPDSTIWTLTYDHWGNVTRLGFPTGGSVSYEYGMAPFTFGATDASRAVTARIVDANDGTGGHRWSYAYSGQYSGSPMAYLGTTVVTSPDGNDTVHTITNPVSDAMSSLFDTQVKHYQGSKDTGTLLKTVATQYSGIASPLNAGGDGVAANVMPIQVTTTWPNGHTSKIVNSWDTGNTENVLGQTVPVVFGSLWQRDEYDFSNVLVRSTLNHYLWQDNTAYKSNNLIALLSSTTVCSQPSNCVDGTLANRVAQTTYGYDQTAVNSSGITTQHNSTPPAGSNIRGNMTRINRWLNSPSTFISSAIAYFDTGMVGSSTDPLGYTTTYTYSPAFLGAYLTQTNMPDTGSPVAHHVISGNYDFNTGLLTSFTDENSRQFTYSYDTATLRLTEGDHPNGGKTTFTYPDPNTVTRQILITDTPSILYDTFTAKFDGLGRPYQTRHVTPAGTAYVDIVYNAVGRTWKVSNPYYQSTDPTYGITETQYDGIGRTIKIIKPDNSVSTASYVSECTTATDEAGKQRKICNDALGRMVNVYEDPAGLNYETDYQYDILNNLARIDQKGSAPTDSTKWHTRTFTYDSLSRLITATNPESGQIFYFYDNTGNLLQEVMPSPNQTGSAQHTISYCYDALNRINGKAYSWQNCQNGQLPAGTPVVTYTYDQGTNGVGHLTSLTDQAGSASYTYDVTGRLNTEQRTIAGVAMSMSYSYNFDGSSKTLTYPSGALVTYTPWNNGTVAVSMPQDAKDMGNGINYVTSATYGADHSLTGYISGYTATFGGIFTTLVYNNRLQPCRIAVSNTSPVASDCLMGWGNVLDLGYDFQIGNGDNGNIYTIYKWGDQTRNRAFTYDALNRLTSAQNAGTDCTLILPDGHTKFWGNSYSYDAWGNLFSKTSTKCTAESLNVTADSQNRIHTISGPDYTYDAAGNMMHDASTGNDYIYDSENRISSVAGYTYTYDADGNRVQKSNGTTGTIYWYMAAGVVAESDLTGSLKAEYIFFGGRRVARRDLPSGAVSYYFSDHLKSASVITDAGGNIKADSDYEPWGGERQFVNNDSNHYKFTGKERDIESGLDYFGARYYGMRLSRFLTPDWESNPSTVPYAQFTDPQTLNLYSYVRNSPIVRVDLDGHFNDPFGIFSGGDTTLSNIRTPGSRLGSLLAESSDSCFCLSQRMRNYNDYGLFVSDNELENALKPQADQARKAMHDQNVVIEGVPADEALKGKTNKQVVDEYHRYLEAQKNGFVQNLPTPNNMPFSDFGQKVMKWGTGDAAARARMQTLTKEELEKSGVTKEMAKKWRDFYRAEKIRRPDNPSAQGRSELMQRAYELLGGHD